jgi:N-acyl-D-aspartate/D-glutamate deacylase
VNDLVVRNGTVVDGTGRKGQIADVAVSHGVVVEIGPSLEPATREIDASGRVVTPGFIDIHTHYDAALMWDPLGTPSVNFGVTTVVAGNCGFGIAPCSPGNTEYLTRLLAGVEGMPYDALVAGLDWNWRSFGDWLDRFEDRLGINAGFLVGHSALRREVLGEGSHDEATPEQVEQMRQMLRDSLAAGGLGFSTSRTIFHQDGYGDPVPSRGAARDELVALAAVVRDHPGTMVEGVFDVGRGHTRDDFELMVQMSLASGRPVNWNVFSVSSERASIRDLHLDDLGSARERGAAIVPVTLPIPAVNRMSLYTGFVLKTVPGWESVWTVPLSETEAIFRDPVRRNELREAADKARWSHSPFVLFDQYRIVEAFAPENQQYVGRQIAEIAREQNRDAFDVLVDICLADGLRTGLLPAAAGSDDASWALRTRTLTDEPVVLGGSDAGAHLDLLNAFVMTAEFIQEAVYARSLITLEQAVHLMTQVPATYIGLPNRGVLAPGMAADMLVLDPERFVPGPVRTVSDLPGGCDRLYAEAEGLDHVLVNGVSVLERGTRTGALPGRLLRSGRDTQTVDPRSWNAFAATGR